MRKSSPRPATLGILMLDNAFERYVGDMGNPKTWDIPVLYRKTPGATTYAITTLQDDAFLAPFLASAEALIADGADGIVTSCGFLAIYQKAMAAKLSVPIATSALLQITLVERLLPQGKRVGVLTFDGASLKRPHLEAVGAPLDVPIIGLESDGSFRRALLGDASVDSYEVREAEAVHAARRLISGHTGIGAIVLECTNLVPHAAAIHAAVQLPVYDVMTLCRWFHSGLTPRVWTQV
jgi:Asp/Glu/hydantoin racemase